MYTFRINYLNGYVTHPMLYRLFLISFKMCWHLLLVHFWQIIVPPYGVSIFHSVCWLLIFLVFVNIFCGNFATRCFRFVSFMFSIVSAVYQNRYAIVGYASVFVLLSVLNIVPQFLSMCLTTATTSSASIGDFVISPSLRNIALILYIRVFGTLMPPFSLK